MLIHRDEAADLRVVVSCSEVNQAGVGVEALAGVEVGDGRAAALAEIAERIIAVGLRRGAVGHEPRRALAVAVDLPCGGAVAVADQGAYAVGRVEIGAAIPGAAVFLCAFGDDFMVRALGVEQVVRFAAGAAVAGEALDAAALGVVAVFDALAAAFDLDRQSAKMKAINLRSASYSLLCSSRQSDSCHPSSYVSVAFSGGNLCRMSSSNSL